MSRLVYFTRETLDLAAPQPADDARRHHHRGGVARVVRRHPAAVNSGSTTAPSQWKNGVELEIFMNVDANAAADRRGPNRARRARSTTSQVQRLPVPHQGRRVRRVQAHLPRPAGAGREHRRRTRCRRRSGSRPTEAELTDEVDAAVRRGAGRRRGADRPGADRPHHRGHRYIRYPFIVDGGASCSRRRCS